MEIIKTPAPAPYTPPDTAIIHPTRASFSNRDLFAAPVHLVQYDKTVPLLLVELYCGPANTPYIVPEGAAVNIRLDKRDGHYVYNPALGLTEGRTGVYFAVTKQMTTCHGHFAPTVEVVIDNDGIVGTASIPVDIDRNPVPVDAIESSDEYRTVQEILVEMRQLDESAKESAQKAKAAQGAAETAREGAEMAEAAAESARDEAAGSMRAAANSAAAATGSAQAANASQNAAQAAQTAAETARTGAESARNAAQSARDVAAGSATVAGQQATAAAGSATAAQTAKTDAETAKTAAETAKTAAEKAKTDAVTAKDTASTKATEAANSATTATQKATAAASSATAAAGSASTASTKASEAAASAQAAKASADKAAEIVGGPIPISKGGTGATTAQAARGNLGVLGSALAGGYQGMTTPAGGAGTGDWIRTTQAGIIPHASDATNGKSALGTSSWPFKDIYGKTLHGALDGNAATATKLKTARTVRTNLGSTAAVNFDGSGNITPGVQGTLPIANGGTGQTTRKAAMNGLAFLGTNPTGGTAGDTRANWEAWGFGYAWISAAGQLNGQPNTYGLLLSIPSGVEIHQLWLSQANGAIYHRGVNGSATAMTAAWHMLYDSTTGAVDNTARTTANAAMPKSGGTFTGNVFSSGHNYAGWMMRGIIVETSGWSVVSTSGIVCIRK